jgi:hypothetical protein
MFRALGAFLVRPWLSMVIAMMAAALALQKSGKALDACAVRLGAWFLRD